MTQGAPSADEVLMGGGRPAAKFENAGDFVGGKIVAEPSTHQEHDVKWDGSRHVKGDPKVFPSGDPIYGITVDVQAYQPSGDDDGVRRIWIEGKRLKEAVRDAVRNGGGQRLEVGGELYVRLTGFGEKPSPTMNAPKLWAAKYTVPPAGPVGQDEAWGPEPTQQQAPPPQQQQAPPQQPPAQQAPPPQQQQAPPQQPPAQQAPPPQEPPADAQQPWPDEPSF